MSKSVKTVTGQRTSVISVPGFPVDVTLSGNQYTVRYETRPSASYKVQEYHSYDAIPDGSVYLTTFGSEPNAAYVYFS